MLLKRMLFAFNCFAFSLNNTLYFRILYKIIFLMSYYEVFMAFILVIVLLNFSLETIFYLIVITNYYFIGLKFFLFV